MPYPLLVKDVLERAGKYFSEKEIMCREPSGDFRYTYGDLYSRCCQLANVLEGLGIRGGDVVDTFGEGSHHHLELLFTTLSMGAVFQPINTNFPDDSMLYLINELGKSKVLFLDEEYIPKIENMRDEIKGDKTYVIMANKTDNLPETKLSPVYTYEELMSKASPNYTFPDDLDENIPATLCRTGGTTGLPKGVIWTQRMYCLLTLFNCLPDGACCGPTEEDTMYVLAPFWYGAGWACHTAVALAGSKMVLPRNGFAGKEFC
jgi:fatty-acyl-CoA synthase